MDIDDLRPNFTSVELIRMDVASNARRWYRLSWEQTTLGWGLVRMYGRIGWPKRTLPPLVFDSLDEVWPTVRATLKKRLRNGYVLQEGARPPYPGVKSWCEPASMTREEIEAFEQLALVE